MHRPEDLLEAAGPWTGGLQKGYWRVCETRVWVLRSCYRKGRTRTNDEGSISI